MAIFGSRARKRVFRFTGSFRYIARMLMFVAIIAVLVGALYLSSDVVRDGFLANVYINGVILIVLAAGVLYTFVQAGVVGPAAGWLKRFQRTDDRHDMPSPPSLIAPMAQLLRETGGETRISAMSARAMLDSLGARMAEAGEIGRYLGRLLIFLGLLGTFWGLLTTVIEITDLLPALSASAEGGDAGVGALLSELGGPLSGMSTAFSSSIFGLAGSLIVGFLDLQAGQCQSRFYNETEEWLSSMSRVSAAGPLSQAAEAGGDGPSAGGGMSPVLAAVLEQAAANTEDLHGVIARSLRSQEKANEALIGLSGDISALGDLLRRQEERASARDDETLMRHMRSLDVTLQKLADELATGRSETSREIRTEIRTLAKALTLALQSDRNSGPGGGTSGGGQGGGFA